MKQKEAVIGPLEWSPVYLAPNVQLKKEQISIAKKLEAKFDVKASNLRLRLSDPDQCDQMEKLFFQYLAIYYNEIMPNVHK